MQYLGLSVSPPYTDAIWYSDDSASTWTNASIGTFDHNSVAFGNGIFVSVGASGQIYTSGAGISWSSQTSGVSTTLFKVVFLYGKFFAVGSAGTVIWSTDGVTWNNISPGGVNTIYSISAIVLQ